MAHNIRAIKYDSTEKVVAGFWYEVGFQTAGFQVAIVELLLSGSHDLVAVSGRCPDSYN